MIISLWNTASPTLSGFIGGQRMGARPDHYFGRTESPFSWRTKTTTTRTPSLKPAMGYSGSFYGAHRTFRSSMFSRAIAWTKTRSNLPTQRGNYPHLRYKTTQWFVPTRLTTLATNTTLDTATRYDTATQTLYIPETGERVIVAARLIAYLRPEFTTTASVTGWRMGFQLGAGPTIDFDRSYSVGNNATRNPMQLVTYDIPVEYLNSYIGTGVSQSWVASLAVSTTAASVVNGITFKLVLTYGFAPTAQEVRIKTICIPIQSGVTALTATQQEVGTDGTSPVASNQIPILDNLPESGKTFRQIMLVSEGNLGGATGLAHTPYLQIDATSEVARATVDRTLQNAFHWQDHYDLTGVISTSSAHAINWRDDQAILRNVGGYLFVTYEYNATTTTSCLYSLLLPFVISTNTVDVTPSASASLGLNTGDPNDRMRLIAETWIDETNPTLYQSAVCLSFVSNSSASTGQAALDLQTTRQWSFLGTSGENPAMMRTDNTGLWSLTRGQNKLPMYYGAVEISSIRWGYERLFACLNYTATPRGDVDDGPRMLFFPLKTEEAGASVTTPQNIRESTAGARWPVLGRPYKILTVIGELYNTGNSLQSDTAYLAFRQQQGELETYGFAVSTARQAAALAMPGTNRNKLSATRWFNATSFQTGRLDIEAPRRIVIANGTAAVAYNGSLGLWVAASNVYYTVSGTITINNASVASGKNVQIFAYQPDQTAELVTTVTTDANGAFSAQVPDNIRTYFAVYQNNGFAGMSLLGTPV